LRLNYRARGSGALCKSEGYFANADEHHLPEAIDYVGNIEWQPSTHQARRNQKAEIDNNFDGRKDSNVMRLVKLLIGGGVRVGEADANGKNKIQDRIDKILNAVNVQGGALFRKCNAAAVIHAENDDALATCSNGESDHVENGVVDVLGHHNDKENVGAVSDENVGQRQ
jgi:hypothetical protein